MWMLTLSKNAGINSAHDVFQRHVGETYESLERVTGISVDVLVSRKTKEEHLLSLLSAFKQARKHGQRYNLEKCLFNIPGVRYYGHVISEDDIKQDQKKSEAIISMAAPTCKEKLQIILGMAKFVPKLSEITAQMRDLSARNCIQQNERSHHKSTRTDSRS